MANCRTLVVALPSSSTQSQSLPVVFRTQILCYQITTIDTNLIRIFGGGYNNIPCRLVKGYEFCEPVYLFISKSISQMYQIRRKIFSKYLTGVAL